MGDTTNNEGSIFDNLEGLRLQQDFATGLGVKRVLTTVTCGKPHKQHFIRVRAGVDWQLEAALLTIDETRETFLVMPQLAMELAAEIKPHVLRLAINRQGTPFIWPLRLPDPNRGSDKWAESAVEAAKIAEKQWTRVAADMDAGMYATYVASAEIPKPEWPELSFSRLLELTFRSNIIGDIDHPMVKRLWTGE